MSVKHNDESAQQKLRGAKISEGSRQEEMGEKGGGRVRALSGGS